jgi:hypothetical protein
MKVVLLILRAGSHHPDGGVAEHFHASAGK